MDEKIVEVLKSIGFTKNEVMIYIDLLKYSPSTALQISKRTKIHRSNVYDILRFLEDRGIINTTIIEDKKVFSAQKPESIYQYLKEKEQEVNNILPLLENVSKNDEKEEIAKVCYGKTGYRNAVARVLEEKKEVRIYNASTNISEIMGPDLYQQWHQTMQKNKTISKIIFSRYLPEIKKRMKYNKYMQMRFLPGEHESTSPYLICGNTVYFMPLTNPLTLIEIKSKRIAESLSKNFDLIWDNLKPVV